MNPQIEEGVTTAQRGNSIRAVQVQNIIARMEGSNSQQTMLLMAHYDSVPYARGAADDAAGVAAILEAVRALQAGPPLQNDVVILFTDAEEGGLMGARYFTENNPLMEEIDLVLNFEARGTSGSSIMFETNDGNDKLIPLFEEATPNPVANSLTYSVYKVLPNDTDFTMFKQHDIQGLNYAFIEDYLDYHTMQDNPENLSLSSLQHHGENLLGNCGYLAIQILISLRNQM
ncbi:MAG: M20/M25/M40 family metallo-hydrolase [Balneolaceae bacterium]|nr:M20/M25/M40 family metallo-hydrolase [Balneolaceae bacterium]